ncbi:MAG: hypothetical protein AAB511_04090 [Patescibacteria group bacterium]
MIHDLRFRNGDELTHHAYLVAGSKDQFFTRLEKEWEIVTKGNPDFHYQKFESLGVDEARELKGQAEGKAFVSGGKKIFVIEASSITVEAQNSLLKMFEEPTPDTHFFLMGNCVRNLIPTLLSRVSKIEIGDAPPATSAARDFLSLSVSDRLTFVKKLADDIKSEKKTKSDALELVQEVEKLVYQKSKKDGVKPPKVLEDIEMCREYLGDRSASVKMLLEYVALVI